MKTINRIEQECKKDKKRCMFIISFKNISSSKTPHFGGKKSQISCLRFFNFCWLITSDCCWCSSLFLPHLCTLSPWWSVRWIEGQLWPLLGSIENDARWIEYEAPISNLYRSLVDACSLCIPRSLMAGVVVLAADE